MGDGITEGYREWRRYKEEIMYKDSRWKMMRTLNKLAIAPVEDLYELRRQLEFLLSF